MSQQVVTYVVTIVQFASTVKPGGSMGTSRIFGEPTNRLTSYGGATATFSPAYWPVYLSILLKGYASGQ